MKPNESETKIHFNGSFIIAPHTHTDTYKADTHRPMPSRKSLLFSSKHSRDTFQSAAQERSEEQERERVGERFPRSLTLRCAVVYPK